MTGPPPPARQGLDAVGEVRAEPGLGLGPADEGWGRHGVTHQHWVVGVLQPAARGPPDEFGRIVIRDGCSFAFKDALREHCPGRFTKQNPAAAELRVTMNLLNESVEQVTRTVDTAPERFHRSCDETSLYASEIALPSERLSSHMDWRRDTKI